MLNVPVAVVMMAFALWLSPNALAAERITLLSGEQFNAPITAIDDAGKITFPPPRESVELAALRGIDRVGIDLAADAANWSPPRGADKPDTDKRAAGQEAWIHLADGGRVRVKDVAISDDMCTGYWGFESPISLPLSLVRAVQWMSATGTKLQAPAAAFHEAVKDVDAEQDRLFVVSGGAIRSIAGIIEQVTKTDVVIVWQGKARPVSRAKIFGLVLAATGHAPDTLGRCRVNMTDGSRLWGKPIGLSSGTLQFNLHGERPIGLAWDQVVSVDVRSDRVVYLSDLDPTAVDESVIVTLPRPWQRDRTVGGQPLKIGKQVFAKGLGVHANSRLTFAADGRFDQFTATIGIDASRAGRGDCVFVVRGDGRELFRQRVTGKDAARELNVDVAGVKTLQIIVEAGHDLDLADHANWCDARLIRNP